MTTTQQERITAIIEAVEAAILQIRLEDLRDGANDYARVRAYPDGEVTSGRDGSYSVPEDEYYCRVPHCLTVYSARGCREAAGPADGVFEWKPAVDGPYLGNERTGEYRAVRDMEDEEIAARLAKGWIRFDLGRDALIEPLMLDEAERDEITARIEEWAAENLGV